MLFEKVINPTFSVKKEDIDKVKRIDNENELKEFIAKKGYYYTCLCLQKAYKEK